MGSGDFGIEPTAVEQAAGELTGYGLSLIHI